MLQVLYQKTTSVIRTWLLVSRFRTFSYTVSLPLIGLATVSPNSNTLDLLSLVAVMVAYQNFAYALNDIIDLEIDRAAHDRPNSPLQQGSISLRQAVIFTEIQVPCAFLLHLIFFRGSGTLAYLLLGASLALMAIYDLYGKRIKVPLLTDLLQAVAWGLLVPWGALAVHSNINGTTLLIAVFQVAFILLINGFHASIRDLATDLRSGMNTTAIWFGARPLESGKIRIPKSYLVYAGGLLVIIYMVVILPFFRSDLDWSSSVKLTTLFIVLSTVIVSFWLCWKASEVLFSEALFLNFRRFTVLGIWHMFCLMSLPVLLILPYAGNSFRVIILACYILPLFSPVQHDF